MWKNTMGDHKPWVCTTIHMTWHHSCQRNWLHCDSTRQMVINENKAQWSVFWHPVIHPVWHKQACHHPLKCHFLFTHDTSKWWIIEHCTTSSQKITWWMKTLHKWNLHSILTDFQWHWPFFISAVWSTRHVFLKGSIVHFDPLEKMALMSLKI